MMAGYFNLRSRRGCDFSDVSAGNHYNKHWKNHNRDTEIGRLLARQIADSILGNKAYQDLFKSARAEW